MKTIFTLLIAAFFLSATAQECSQYYMQQEGQQLIYHQFNKRDRHELTNIYKVAEFTPEAGGHSMSIDLTIIDAIEDEIIIQGSFAAKCSLGTTSLEPRSLIAPGLFRQYEGMEHEIEGDNLTMPNNLSVGQILPNAQVTMKVKMSGIGLKTQVFRNNQIVDRQETISTPAGTFNCFVITYTNILKMGLAKTYYTTVWVTEGIGMVQEETRKSNNRLISRTVLQNISHLE